MQLTGIRVSKRPDFNIDRMVWLNEDQIKRIEVIDPSMPDVDGLVVISLTDGTEYYTTEDEICFLIK